MVHSKIGANNVELIGVDKLTAFGRLHHKNAPGRGILSSSGLTWNYSVPYGMPRLTMALGLMIPNLSVLACWQALLAFDHLQHKSIHLSGHLEIFWAYLVCEQDCDFVWQYHVETNLIMDCIFHHGLSPGMSKMLAAPPRSKFRVGWSRKYTCNK